jgi:cytochrome c oxidase subunit II
MVRRIGGLAGMLTGLLASGTAFAAQPEPWGTRMQEAASPLMGQIEWFEGYTLVIITLITLFVLALLIVVVVKFNAKANPVPSTTSHNTMIEIVWTILPVLILVAIAFPSFRLLYTATTIPDPDLTVKATGASWYWNYEYTDEAMKDVQPIASNMLKEDGRAERKEKFKQTDQEAPRLLAVDYPLAVPVNKVVHVLTTSNDVNHAFALPAFGLKTDAIQGRLNENWFEATAPGVYWGQCSELCGQNHAFMPLEIHVLDDARWAQWVELQKTDPDKARDQLFTWQSEDRAQAVALK